MEREFFVPARKFFVTARTFPNPNRGYAVNLDDDDTAKCYNNVTTYSEPITTYTYTHHSKPSQPQPSLPWPNTTWWLTALWIR
jgi:hypothetical protein